MRHHASQDIGKSGAPIAQVLNDTESVRGTINPSSASHGPQAASFSGKLADLLLDTTGQVPPNERRRVEQQHEEPARTAGEVSVFKLPQLPQQPTKPVERARLPPLLQGLHQPPPLPASGRLFPPITDGASGFEQDIRNRFTSGNASHDARSKAKNNSTLTRTAETNDLNEVDEEHDRDERDELPSAEPAHRLGQEKTASSAADGGDRTAAVQISKGRKRKKWSDDETKDLLLGVSRFGIGKWKRILQCPDYAFHGRTAVDLKDRFRVCCPDEGAQKRRPKRQGEAEDEFITSPTPSTHPKVSTEKAAAESDEVPVRKEVTRADAEDRHRTKHPKLVELGIETPFAKSTRRPRQKFTSRDDENLRKGFEKYGAVWHSMRDDRELEFGTRHPTDLRDRFRIRYSEIYAEAGYKTKTKPKLNRAEGHSPKEHKAVAKPFQGPNQPPSEPRKRRSVEDSAPEVIITDTTERSLSLTSGARNFPYTSYPMDSSTFLFGDVSSGMPQDKDGTFSPIVLNRNILQWADANNFLIAHTNTTSGNLYGTSHALDMSMHNTYPNDGIHIDPMATLKLPLMAIGGHNNMPTGSAGPSFMMNYTSSAAPSTTANTRATYSATTSDTLSVPSPWPTSFKTASSDDLLRTPNLPTIVFPHVPAASARGAVHNLPTPADLLSGMGHGGDTDIDGDFGWSQN